MSCNMWENALEDNAIEVDDFFKGKWTISGFKKVHYLKYCPFCDSELLPEVGCSKKEEE